MKFKNKLKISLTAVVAVFAILSYLSLDKLHWEDELWVGAPQHVVFPVEGGSKLIRFKDHAEQIFYGEWDFDFAPSGRVYAYQGNALYLIDEGILPLTLENENPITGVTENANGTHVSVLQEKNGKKNYCVMPIERIGDAECDLRTTGGLGSWYWHPSQERTMILEDEKGGRAMFLIGGEGFIYEGVFPDPPASITWRKRLWWLRAKKENVVVDLWVPRDFTPLYADGSHLVGHIRGEEIWVISLVQPELKAARLFK